MTINANEQILSEYTGNGTQKKFPIPFSYINTTDLKVSKIDAQGKNTLLSFGLDYSVYPEKGLNGGELTTALAPSLNTTLKIELDPIIEQEMDLKNNGILDAEALETALDKLTLICKTLKAKLSNL
ncbi:hypothetical protein [Desulfovibrio litoralis]|uniref:Uncharacterized protein n=1 Tax=Desulfovibrio litoralis DSM 11393 TaxID=1121455 RepID=A0A1M7SWJ8_9BACT|nr:hypothetical protein [Desulfovibrio litoralis]SHN62852.1 hypothetical protein SAMN02745728_01309 [Desulfovibrio litoralis DSM 11393]